MSSFFTTPASLKKRKRDDADAAPATKKRTTSKSANTKPQKSQPSKPKRDESISSDGSEDEARNRRASIDLSASESGSEDEDETAAERRLRLAEDYLKSLKSTVEEVGFDAEEIDRDLIAERLQEDVAETKGRLYKYIASSLSFKDATKTHFHTDALSATSAIATCPPYVYTVTKDMRLTKWELPSPPPPPKNPHKIPKKPPKPTRRRPTHLLSCKGNTAKSADPDYKYHTGAILAVAASDTGTFIATGGADKRLIIYSADTLTPIKVFPQHRDAVTSLAFRRGTNQLYSASKDRTVKVWSLDDLAYVETLFGHQDSVVDVAALSLERCVSVGARDRTARLWKVVEETQLVFRGLGPGSKPKKPAKRNPKASTRNPQEEEEEDEAETKAYAEGSLDVLALLDDETFVTGSDNGTLSLWSTHKKKPLHSVPLAHGLSPRPKATDISPETNPDDADVGVYIPAPQPRWITALASVPFSDVVVSGSWDGEVRVWRVSGDKRRLEGVGVLGKGVEKPLPSPPPPQQQQQQQTKKDESSVSGVINGLSVFERGAKGKETLCVVAAVGREHRLGRWSVQGKGGAVVWEVPRVIATGSGGGGGGGGEGQGKGKGLGGNGNRRLGEASRGDTGTGKEV